MGQMLKKFSSRPSQIESDKEMLLREFKNVYKVKGARDLQSQVKYLTALAGIYHQKGVENADWVCLLKAHTLYNSVSARDKANENKWSAKAFEVQKTYWGKNILLSYEQQKEIIDCVKRELTEVRESTRSKLDFIKAKFISFDCEELNCQYNTDLYEVFMKHVESASQHCTNGMIRVFQLVIHKAVQILGEAPCEFCVAALGSLARGEATPYSDLEFLFLIGATSSKIVKYFESLALTVYFLIGNLQETKLKYMAIEELTGWFDDVSINGLKIDGLQRKAGNIPTGNGSGMQHNHFICTVDQLVVRYEMVYNNPHPEDSLTGDLTAMLSCTVAVFGNSELLDAFTAKIQSMRPNLARLNASKRMLVNDVEKYNFYPDESLSLTRDMKSDIYRYPSMLLLNLKIIHQLVNCSPRDILDELVHRKILSSSVASYLRFTFSCALYIRFSTYFHHNSQNDTVSVLSVDPHFLTVQDRWYIDRPLFLHMMKHLMPLKEAVKNSELEADLELCNAGHEVSVAVTSYYCSDYQGCYDKLKDLEPNEFNPDIVNMLICSARFLGKLDEAKNLCTKCLDYQLQQYEQADHPDVATSFSALGILHEYLGQYEQAELFYTKSLDMRERLYQKNDHLDIAASYSSLGLLYMSQGQYSQAIEYCTKSSNMRQRLYGGTDNVEIAGSYTNLGSVYYRQGQYDMAEVYHTKAIEMKQRLYGKLDHPDVAYLYNNLGSVHDRQGQYDKAELYHTMSLQMKLRLYGNSDHPDISYSYSNLGSVYFHQGRYDKAELYHTKSLEMTQRLYGKSDHPDTHTATSYNNLGSVYFRCEQLEKARIYHTKSLEMRRQLYKDADHPDVAHSYNNLGSVYYRQGDYKQAELYQTKSLEMKQRLYRQPNHPHIAESYRSLSQIYRRQGLNEKAQKYISISKGMKRKVYGTLNCHRDISNSCMNLHVDCAEELAED